MSEQNSPQRGNAPVYKNGNVAIWLNTVGANHTEVYKIVDGPKGDQKQSSMLASYNHTKFTPAEVAALYSQNPVNMIWKGGNGPYAVAVFVKGENPKPYQSAGIDRVDHQLQLSHAFLTLQGVRLDEVGSEFQIQPDMIKKIGIRMPDDPKETKALSFWPSYRVTTDQTQREVAIDAVLAYHLANGQKVEVDGVMLEMTGIKETPSQRGGPFRDAVVRTQILEQTQEQNHADDQEPDFEEEESPALRH